MDSEFISVAVGEPDGGAWIVNERVDVHGFQTRHTQIWITPNLSGAGFVLTHARSGFFLLGPFDDLVRAREAADKLVSLFPLFAAFWERSRMKQLVRRLSAADRQWLRDNGAFAQAKPTIERNEEKDAA